MDRRGFLNFGRNALLPQSDWDVFCHRVQRLVQGEFSRVEHNDPELQAAYITLRRLEDSRHLLALCKEYEVAMVLAGCATAETVLGRHCLIIHIADSLNTIEAIGQDACLAQPGVLVGDLLAQGYQQFARVPVQLNLAQWLSSPAYHDVRPFHSFLSGLERVHALFSDASQAVIGNFGHTDRSALSVPILNHSIPNFFELLRDDAVERALESDYWPFRYRLDSLKKHFVEVNLARLFLGHQGGLIWSQEMVIRKIPQDVLLLPESVQRQECPDLTLSIHHLQSRVKGILDPYGVFVFDDEVLLS